MQIKINSSSGNFKFSTFEQKRGHYLEFIAFLQAEFSKFGINVFHKSIAFMFRVCKKKFESLWNILCTNNFSVSGWYI